MLPGGRCQIGEPSNQALEREIREELGVTFRVPRLLWFVEIFYGNTSRQIRELVCIYLFDLPGESPLLAKDHIYAGTQGDKLRLIFRWFPFAKLLATRFYLTFLRTEIANLPAVQTHLIHNDENDEAET